ncbi:MAG: acyl carrier protein [Lachnospiraceae bacterium]|nr:acyl carrier protein [Lachnospiraceae bacterium]MBR4175333.1 acyl carrier protein [Lachnospiraceae bacterium]
MTREKIFEDVTEIFRDVFDDDELVIGDETNSADIEDWDSLEHIELVINMEKHFGLKFNIKEVNKLQNVGEMVDLIQRMLEG